MHKSRADYILGELERKPNIRPLNILLTSTHPMTDKNLCRTGHNIFNLDIPQFPIKWQTAGHVPDNMKIIHSIEELPCRPDVIISQNIVDQFNHWMNMSFLFDCPVISFEHTLPTAEWLRLGIPEKITNDLVNTTRVFISEFSKLEWKAPTSSEVIYHMANTDKYKDWLGGNGRAAMLVNAFSGREWAVGNVEELLVKDNGKRIDLFGNNPGYLSKPLNEDEVIRTLQDYDVFVNTSIRSPIPASLLEAAAVGTPIVTTSNSAIPEFFKNEVNCLTFSTIDECFAQIDRLLGDKVLRKQLSTAARETILSKFNEQRYTEDWNRVITKTMERHHG